ncbi:hypothetical protein MPER_05276 [Moniliophthora perniciosa FA553]|nr:hypothetical protein MPER_05276 [Moniliophthora perniciosa FA553]
MVARASKCYLCIIPEKKDQVPDVEQKLQGQLDIITGSCNAAGFKVDSQTLSTSGNETTGGNGTTSGNETTGNGTSGNGTTGDGTAGNGTTSGNTGGNGTSGNGGVGLNREAALKMGALGVGMGLLMLAV